jgi:hypothetical protein
MSSRGKAQIVYLQREGLVSGIDQPDYGFLYDVTAVQDPKWSVGDIVDVGTKRFVYCKSAGACYTGRGASFKIAISDGIDFSLLSVAQAIGDKQITFVGASHAAFTKDQLKGGLVLISDQDSGGTQDAQVQQRICIGNDASALNSPCTIYLDAPLTRAVTAATEAFVMPSPYSGIALNAGGDGYQSIAGVPVAYVSATAKYFWLQTRGPCWLAPQAGVGATAWKRGFVWRHDGTIQLVSSGGSSSNTDQYGGYIVDNNTGANGATFVMLTSQD